MNARLGLAVLAGVESHRYHRVADLHEPERLRRALEDAAHHIGETLANQDVRFNDEAQCGFDPLRLINAGVDRLALAAE